MAQQKTSPQAISTSGAKRHAAPPAVPLACLLIGLTVVPPGIVPHRLSREMPQGSAARRLSLDPSGGEPQAKGVPAAGHSPDIDAARAALLTVL